MSRNDADAARWFRLAADQGYAAAQFNLGRAYAIGQGVPQDDVRAHVWLSLAALQPSANRERWATARDELANTLSVEQLAETRRLVREWKTKFDGETPPR